MDLFHSLLKYFFFFSWGSHYSEDICVLHAVSEQNVTKPSCQYSAEMCLGEQSFHFLHAGPCHGDSNLDWAIERAKLSTNSLKKVPCGYDTCYDWEECPGMTSEWWDLSSPLDLKIKHAESFTAPGMGLTGTVVHLSNLRWEDHGSVVSPMSLLASVTFRYVPFPSGTSDVVLPLPISKPQKELGD